ncbi:MULTISPECIES: alginate O-acetyltransferase AlgF [unclassified Pseudomonas]|uniref:alginate O-acetyltransferase AlgF n=1 Tax=unclassified Pseudomonas TaxID=196821 RepID=UPI00191397D8|nr:MULTISPECIES: alginate O-acetyltransferase AlgF [unclassified Pseudomonas]MBK5553487.1 alginate O-acetyltransferase AlgF [Pseudomonas sp. TH03]MEB0225186.1 alginate O-acetyltransferase AlgF [Pseudomonas sp. 5S1]MEB0293982.1 alginate O-acetyltransferase AlgF [Pseudomonas sp. 10S4]WPX17021.1 alginate O-acetyltransferase AlgF [Pseudomonas sp. 10S4]
MTRAELAAALSLLLSLHAQGADITLYPTGPDQDSAFLRFINAADQPLQIQAEGSRANLQLEGQNAVSDYLSVPVGKPIKGTLERSGKSQPLNIQVMAGEFATVIALPDGTDGLRPIVIREQPDDFNSLRASLAFINADPTCPQAGLRAARVNAELFKDVASGSVQRRAINPVSLSVQLVCSQTDVGVPLDLGQLKAGERYSVVLLPGANGPYLLLATDVLAH